jgi:transposase InsO family protein
MIGLLCFILAVLASPFKSTTRLEAENAALRRQLIVLRRKVKGRALLTNNDRWFFIQMYRWFRRLRAMSIRNRPTAPRSPWQNGYCERAIGSIRRECLDHVVVFGERHLRHLLQDTSVSGQRSADLAAGSADRSHHFKSDPWRTPSPLNPNLGFRYTQPGTLACLKRPPCAIGERSNFSTAVSRNMR